MSWNLYSESKGIITTKNKNRDASGLLLNPGEYSAQLFKQIDGEFSSISTKVNFNVNRLRDGALNNASDTEKITYSANLYKLRNNSGSELSNRIKELKSNIELLLKSYEESRINRFRVII